MNDLLISIILPIRNEQGTIRPALEAILAQDYPLERLEILVADGMSADHTREIVQEYQVQHPQVQLIDNPGKIVPTGMNAALRVARGEIIIRVDGHCLIAPDYVRNCVDHLLNDGVAGVGGPMQSIGETPLSQTIAVAMSSTFGVGNSAFRTMTGKTMLADTVPFPAYTRAIIQQVGLYDEELMRNQDDEYNYRIREHGGKILLAEDVRSQYFSRGSLGKLWQQYFQYGFYKVRVLQKHPKQMSPRQFVPPAFVSAVLLAMVLSIFTNWGVWLLALVGLSYLAANLLASLLTAARRGRRSLRHLPLLPLTFAILHLSYGLGFLSGLFKFWNRWGDKHGRVPEVGLGGLGGIQ